MNPFEHSNLVAQLGHISSTLLELRHQYNSGIDRFKEIEDAQQHFDKLMNVLYDTWVPICSRCNTTESMVILDKEFPISRYYCTSCDYIAGSIDVKEQLRQWR